MRSRLLPIFMVVFVDLLGFGFILPLLPFYAETYGATPLVIGLLTASYAAAQLVGAPLLGRLSDRYGRRPILLVSISGTLVALLLLALADPIARALVGSDQGGLIDFNWMVISILFFSRIVDGLTGGNISIAQAYITDITDEHNRARGLGLIGAAFGLGFILGPAFGGFLSTWGYSVPAFAAAGLSAINWLSIAFLLPESLTSAQRERISTHPKPAFTLQALWQAINRPRVGPLFHIRFFFGFAFAIFQTMFPLFSQYRLGFDARQTGFLLAYVGLLVALVQGVGVGALVRRYSETRLILAGAGLMTFALLAWAFTFNIWMMLLVLAPLALAGGTLNTVINSTLTKAVLPEEVGGTLGLSASLESLTRVLAPSIGGVLFGQIGVWAPGVLGAGVMVWVTLFAWRRLILNPDPPLQQKVISS